MKKESSRAADIAGTIGLVVVLGVAVLAVVLNIRNCAKTHDNKEKGWDVASYLATATEKALDWKSDARLIELKADYVDSKGRAQLGNRNADLRFYFGSPSLAPAPAAPTRPGAIPQTTTNPNCRYVAYIHDQRPQLTGSFRDGGCLDAPIAALHCSVLDIWKRAIAKGAPADALATIGLAGRTWSFKIVEHQANDPEDEKAKALLAYEFPDDCVNAEAP